VLIRWTLDQYYNKDGGSCVEKCEHSHYAQYENFDDSLNPMCQPCNRNCSLCYERTINDCTECVVGYYLNVTTCMLCPSKCTSCYWSSVNDCTRCSQNYFLEPPNTCTSDCSGSFYGNDTNPDDPVCSPCTPECTSCFGPNIT
jgi:hypothetical protein